jgi:hypothetical protein
MIAIVNIGKNIRHSGPHKYELRINRAIITEFTHNRERPLWECLRKAADAAEMQHLKNIRKFCDEVGK